MPKSLLAPFGQLEYKAGMEDDFINQYYNKLAKVHGNGPRMSMRDMYIRETEFEFFKKSLELQCLDQKKNFKILDLGCGNGFVCSKLQEELVRFDLEFTGLEYCEELFKICLSAKKENLNFIHGDARNRDIFAPKSFDAIVSERAIINILNLKEQKSALSNIEYWLKPGGHYYSAESFREPLHELSMASQEMNFEELKPSKHNLFLWKKNFKQHLESLNMKKLDPATKENYLSTHFYLTRVIHRLIRPEGGKKNPKLFQKFFHEALPPAVGNFSPILFQNWQKPLAH